MVCVVAWAVTAHAGPKEDAEKHFRAGVSLQKVEDFEAAIVAFEASLRLFPTKSALFNLANCYKATHRYVDALTTLEQLEREYGAELKEPMLGAVQSLKAELEGLTVWLTIEAEPEGADIFVDGEHRGQAPLSGPLRLGLGEHELRVSAQGYETATQTVSLASGAEVTQRIELQAPSIEPEPEVTAPTAVAAPPPQPLTPAPDTGDSGLLTTGWVTTGVGALLLLGGTATGIWALSVDGDLSDACEAGHCPRDRAEQIDQLDTLTSTTNVLLGAGALLGAAGVVLLLIEGGSGSTASQTHASRPAFGVAVGPGYWSVSAGHGF